MGGKRAQVWTPAGEETWSGDDVSEAEALAAEAATEEYVLRRSSSGLNHHEHRSHGSKSHSVGGPDETARRKRAARKFGGSGGQGSGSGSGPGSTSHTPRSRSGSRGRLTAESGGEVRSESPGLGGLVVQDKEVLRQIERDLAQLARKQAEKHRSKQRREQRDAKDLERSASRLTGAGAAGNVLHTPLAAAVSQGGIREHVSGGNPTGGCGLGGGWSSKRGSFTSVTYSGASSDDDGDGASVASGSKSTPHEREREAAEEDAIITAIWRRRNSQHSLAVGHGGGGVSTPGGGGVPDSLRYIEVMSRYLSKRGVHASLLDELESSHADRAAAALVDLSETNVLMPEEEESAAGYEGVSAGEAEASALKRSPSDAAAAALAMLPLEPTPSPVSVENALRRFPSSASPHTPLPSTPGTLSPSAVPFTFDGRLVSSTPKEEEENIRSALGASIAHMVGSGAVPGAEEVMAAAMADRSPLEQATAMADRGPEAMTPTFGAEATARASVRQAGECLRAALAASTSDPTDSGLFLGDAQRASADLLHELEKALDSCQRAVASLSLRPCETETLETGDGGGGRNGTGRDCEAGLAAAAAGAHQRLGAVLLEEVTAGSAYAAETFRKLTEAITRASEEEAAAGEAADQATAADLADETGAAAAAAVAAEHMADEAAEQTAAALVRAAHAGAWVAQHLSVTFGWSRRVASWAGKPPAPRAYTAEEGEGEVGEVQRYALLRQAETTAAAARVADEAYTHATFEMFIPWAKYMGIAVAAAPRAVEDEEDKVATRRSFLRSLWVQTFIAQSCVQGFFIEARLAHKGVDWDLEPLMLAVKQVIYVATTVENQLHTTAASPGGISASTAPLPAAEAVVFGSPQRLASAPRDADAPGTRTQLSAAHPAAGDGSAAAVASASRDYIDALWTSVSQVKSLRFKEEIRIGRGGFSNVLRATWRGSTVAVKVLDPKKINGDVVNAMKNEVTAMTANRHPHIVTVLAVCMQASSASIIMEHCKLGSLSDVLAKTRRTPERLCWRVRLLMASDAACGLAYLHSSSNQIAHRDINTQNLLVTEDMRVKIADFGLSRLVRRHGGGVGGGKSDDRGKGGGGTGKDDAGFGMDEHERDAISGGLRSCLFHAPEVISADATTRFGPSADVFSFGCVLWCLATLAPPWEEVQKEHEDQPDMVKFMNIMQCVAERVTKGDRLPLPPLVPMASLLPPTPPRPKSPLSAAFKTTAKDPVLAPTSSEPIEWSLPFAQQTKLVNVIDQCFRSDPEERPSMASVLQELRIMRREERKREFNAHPPPQEWDEDFIPPGVPHMSGTNFPSLAPKLEENLVRSREKPSGKGETAADVDSAFFMGSAGLSNTDTLRVAAGALLAGMLLGALCMRQLK